MNNLDKLKDIKASQIIQIDFTPYIFIAIGILIVGFIVIGLFIFFKGKKRVRITRVQKAKNILKAMDFKSDTKSIVYNFSVNGYECLDDKNKDEFNHLLQKLEIYKYKQTVNKLPDDLIADMKEYIKVRV